MNIQQTDKLIDRIKAMETLAENANHEWLLGWFTPIKVNNLSTKETIAAMLKAWAYFRATCKRSNLEFQGFRQIKFGMKHGQPVFEVTLSAFKGSLEVLSETLSNQFESNGFQAIIKQPISTANTTQYIEKYFSKSHTAEQQERLRNIAGIQPIAFIKKPTSIQ